MIYKYAQFVNQTVDKVPFDPATGFPVNAMDPANWKTYEQAKATGHPVGFVLTAADPFFFIDLDKCLQADGTWTQSAIDVCAYFPGAAMEVSQSGKGLHIVGTMQTLCDVKEFKNKVDGWFEFYFQERILSFGPYEWQGDFGLDCTNAIHHVVPKRPLVDNVALVAGPCAEYTGPTDDATLIAKMLASTGSMAAMFNGKASIQDLWQANADVLGKVYPAYGDDAYDRSSADAALMAHLAFWTGRDFTRMDRLFRQSGLVRDKYINRADYQTSTITNAIAGCKQVYDKVQANVPNEDLGEFLFTRNQIDYFKGCVYVRAVHRVMIDGGDLLKAEQFKAFYGGYEFQMEGELKRSSRNAFEAFTENRMHKFPKVVSLAFRPLLTPGAIINEGGIAKVNQYFPANVDRTPGDVAPYLDLLKMMIPDERDRIIYISYMASLVRNPGIKFQWAPVIQGIKGNGKSFILKCLDFAVGPKYTHWPAAKKLDGVFNSYLEGKLLIVVDEMDAGGNRELLEVLKPLITSDMAETEPKGVDKRMIENVANWSFAGNHKDLVPVDAEERRYAIWYCAQQTLDDLRVAGMLSPTYFPKLWNWAKSGGFANVAHYLHTVDIPDEFDPATTLHRAPTTTSTREAIAKSLSPIKQDILECVDCQEQGFRGGWVSSAKIEDMLREKGAKISRGKVIEILEELGYKSMGRASRPIFNEANKRPTLHYLKNSIPPVGDPYTAYCTAQGYTLPGQPVGP